MADTQPGGETGAIVVPVAPVAGELPGAVTQLDASAVAKPSDGKPAEKLIPEAEVKRMLDAERSRLDAKWKAEEQERKAKESGQFKDLYEQIKAQHDPIVTRSQQLESENAELVSLIVPEKHRAALEIIPPGRRAAFVKAALASGLFTPAPTAEPQAAGSKSNPPVEPIKTPAALTRSDLESAPGILDGRKLAENAKKLRQAQKGA